jgi:N-acetylglucosamine-6-sulfatase
MKNFALAAAVLAASACVTQATQARAQARPNIVVIMTDDQDDNSQMATMPLTRYWLENRGVRFNNSFVNFPQCTPARASFLTGKMAHNTGVVSNSGGYDVFKQYENSTIAVALKNSGYVTSLIGKYFNGYNVTNPNLVPPGWSQWNALLNGSYNDFLLNENGTTGRYNNTIYQTDLFADKAVAFIQQQANTPQPFFLMLTPTAPHSNGGVNGMGPPTPAARHDGYFANLTLEPQYQQSFNEANVSDKPSFVQAQPLLSGSAVTDEFNYYRKTRETMLAVDDMVGRIAVALNANAKLQNTIVIYTSDNGFSYYNHRAKGKGVVYEESVRVPLIIRGPGIPLMQSRDQMASNVDVTATILAAAQVAAPHLADGRDLMPVMQNNTVLGRYRLLLQGPGITADPPIASAWKAVRTLTDVYSEPVTVNGVEREYYDLAVDPYQLVNKVDDPIYATRVVQMKTLLDALKTCAGTACK